MARLGGEIRVRLETCGLGGRFAAIIVIAIAAIVMFTIVNNCRVRPIQCLSVAVPSSAFLRSWLIAGHMVPWQDHIVARPERIGSAMIVVNGEEHMSYNKQFKELKKSLLSATGTRRCGRLLQRSMLI